jgi:hypothetical protein
MNTLQARAQDASLVLVYFQEPYGDLVPRAGTRPILQVVDSLENLLLHACDVVLEGRCAQSVRLGDASQSGRGGEGARAEGGGEGA